MPACGNLLEMKIIRFDSFVGRKPRTWDFDNSRKLSLTTNTRAKLATSQSILRQVHYSAMAKAYRNDAHNNLVSSSNPYNIVHDDPGTLLNQFDFHSFGLKLVAYGNTFGLISMDTRFGR
jgi:hypothetical protein